MQSVSSRIWTRVVMSISSDDNHYTTGTSSHYTTATSVRRIWYCVNTPPSDPHYLNQPNYSWPSESSSGFSHLWPEVFQIPLPTHKIHNREGERKRTNKTQAWVSSKRKKGEVCDTFLAFCASVS